MSRVGRMALVLAAMLGAGVPATPQDRLFDEQERAVQERERAREEQGARQHELRGKVREQTRALREQARERRSGEDALYEMGTRSLDEREWDRAIEAFSRVVERAGHRADGALYWKAYAQNMQGRREEALATLGQLGNSYPSSRWLEDYKALEVEIQQAAGRPVNPESQGDEELKLYALNGLLASDPERALPILEKFLQGNHSPKLKERALFVLSQSRLPHAREIIAQMARGKANPDLQLKAVTYLGLYGGKDSLQTLADIYRSTPDVDVKRAILKSFFISKEKDRLLAAAKTEPSPELRGEAVRLLGLLRAQAEVWQLYQGEASPEAKQHILEALFLARNGDKLIEVARSDKDPQLRRSAIRKLGILRSDQSGAALASLYAGETDAANRREIIQALFLQQNAKALVEIARKETDPELKKETVRMLSLLKSKEATDYLMEILNK